LISRDVASRRRSKPDFEVSQPSVATNAVGSATFGTENQVMKQSTQFVIAINGNAKDDRHRETF
jgi:hypothetical protein